MQHSDLVLTQTTSLLLSAYSCISIQPFSLDRYKSHLRPAILIHWSSNVSFLFFIIHFLKKLMIFMEQLFFQGVTLPVLLHKDRFSQYCLLLVLMLSWGTSCFLWISLSINFLTLLLLLFIFSDMAPNASGNHTMSHEAILVSLMHIPLAFPCSWELFLRGNVPGLPLPSQTF